MGMTTYGKLELVGDRWQLTDIPPHVAIRLKNIFQRIDKTTVKKFTMPASDPMTADLAWFMERYPFEMSDKDAKWMKRAVKRFNDDRADTEAILLPGWVPPPSQGFRPGYGLRPKQMQADQLIQKRKRLLLGDDVGFGKEQPLWSNILTPTGWKKMAHIHAGDLVIGSDGAPCRVTRVYPQGQKDVYRITFSDGAQAECGLDHLWIVRDQNRRLRGNGWTTKTTKDLLRSGVKYTSGTPKWEIPVAAPIQFEPRNEPLPIHPYLLGALLGDGHFTKWNICLSVAPHQNEILERVKAIVGEDRISGPHGGSCPQWHILGEKPLFNSIGRGLKYMGLKVKGPQKFIPVPYLFSSPEERLELLRGLMDTDGSCVNNRVAFHTKSGELAHNLAHLVRSLGGTSTVRTYDRSHHGKGIEFNVNVRMDECPFHLSAKVAQWRKCEKHGRTRRFIRSIEMIDSAEQQCITVDSHDHSYITDDFVVTHNTWVSMSRQAQAKRSAVIVQAHLATQWVNKFIVPYTEMTAHIIDGTSPYDLPDANTYVFRYSNISGWVDIAAQGLFHHVTFDEIQELRTGTESEKGRAAKVFSDNAHEVLGLSATPVFNYGSEIWNIMRYIDPDVLGPWDEFTREWCTMGNGDKWLVNEPDALGSYLRESGVFLRRVRDGRPINRIVVDVAYDHGKAAETENLARILALQVINGGFGQAGQAARELDALARRVTGLAKAKSVAAYAKLFLSAGIPIILAGWHRDVYEVWMKELAEFRPVMYTGSETIRQKDKAINDFVAGYTNLFIISLRSGAGIDGLQKRCATVIVGELDWSPQIYEQLFGRVDREGQIEDEITAIFCTCDYGSDPTVIAVNAVKRDQARGITDPGVGVLPVHTDVSHVKLLAQEYIARSS